MRSTEREYVITVKDGKAKLIDIKEGLAGKDSTEVFGGLKSDDRIILKASDELKEGDLVN